VDSPDKRVCRWSSPYQFRTELITPTFHAPIRAVVAGFILPEAAKIRSVDIPIAANVYQLTEVANLDLHGRVVVHVETGTLANIDRISVVINYTMGPFANLIKLALLDGALCVIFVGIILGRRIDLGINVGPSPPVSKVKSD
jgi:hypothetical protein